MDLNDRIKEFVSKGHINSLALVSRSGIFLAGSVPQSKHKDTLSAMLAIIEGGAETASLEMGKPLSNVIVRLKDEDLIVKPFGTKAILAATAPKMTAAVIEGIDDFIEAHKDLVR